MSEPNYKAGYERLLRTMQGIQACGTKCPCCEMLRRLADNAVREAPLALDVPAGTRPAFSIQESRTDDPPMLEIPRFLRSGDD